MKRSFGLFIATLLTASWALAANPEARVSISAVGDIMMGTTYPQNALPDHDGADLFRRASSYLHATDITFGNLEGPLYNGGQNQDGKADGSNRYIFRTPTTYAARLKEAGFNVMGLANNHAHDFGMGGVLSTKNALQKNGIQYSSKDGDVALFEVQGLKIALIATDFYPGRRSITTPAQTYHEIKNLKIKYDLVIVYAHAGGEGDAADHVRRGSEVYLGENRGDSLAFAHGAIDAGADLILMSGPHVPRAMELYKNHLIAYSLGNFVTERGISVESKAGLAPLLQVQIDGNGHFVEGRLVSFLQTRTQGIVLDTRASASELIQHLSQEDFPDSHPLFMQNGRLLPLEMNSNLP